MFVVCVTSWVKPEFTMKYIEACEDNASATREEPGCLRFDFLNATDQDNRFFFYEVYRSEEDFNAHHKTEHYLKWKDMVGPWMDQRREGVKYESISPNEETDW